MRMVRGRTGGRVYIGAQGSGTTINCRNPVDEGHFQDRQFAVRELHHFCVNENEGYSIENQNPGLSVTITPDDPSLNSLWLK